MRGPFRTVELHTGGEPVRIVVAGLPEIPGSTILAKRRYAREHLDDVRRTLMAEPRGHADMYGVWPVAPDLPDVDLAVLFTHNAGFSTMCGHATIALGRWAVEEGLVDVPPPDTDGVSRTPVRLQAPCGVIEIVADVRGGRVGEVRFRSVPAFVSALDVPLTVDGVGAVTVDVAYGGAFYALVDAEVLGVEIGTTPLDQVVRRATAVTRAAAEVPLTHPDASDLSFLYGTIVRDVDDGRAPEDSRNVCVFADRQVDRSPTGSGVTARTAVRHARGSIAVGQQRRFTSLTGATFTATVVAEHAPGASAPAGIPAVTVEVGGRAHRTGSAEFVIEEDDPLRDGFLLR